MNKLHFAELRVLLGVLLGCLSLSGQLTAAVRYVDLNSTNPVPPFTDWSTAATTIQAAVDEATSGDTVRIAPGDYYEQVVLALKSNLELVGDPGVVLHAFPGMSESLRSYGWSWSGYPVLGMFRSDVVLSGLAIDGEHLGDLYADSRLMGIWLLGSSGLVTNCVVRGFRGPGLIEAAGSLGVHCLNPDSLQSPVVDVRVLDSIFSDNEASFLLRGDPGQNPHLLRARVTIKGNTITGFGPAPVWSVGIWIVDGVAGDIIGNLIRDYSNPDGMQSCGVAAYDAAAQSRGRFIPLQRLNFESNVLTNNGQHMTIVGGNESRIANNVFAGTGPNPLAWGGLALSGTNIVVANNNFADMPIGIKLLNEPWDTNWPAMIPAYRPLLAANWFCNVPEPVRIDGTNVNGVQEQGTETCPFKPQFQSITKTSTGEVRTLLRGWHGESVTLETSTNLVDWVPVHTHVMELPLHECHDTNGDGVPQRFYRAAKP